MYQATSELSNFDPQRFQLSFPVFTSVFPSSSLYQLSTFCQVVFQTSIFFRPSCSEKSTIFWPSCSSPPPGLGPSAPPRGPGPPRLGGRPGGRPGGRGAAAGSRAGQQLPGRGGKVLKLFFQMANMLVFPG